MKMGFEGLVYYGTAGSTASTLIENRGDVTIDVDPQTDDTTVAGDGTGPPLESEDVATRKWSATMNMKNDSSDSVLEALRVAACAGTQVAIRMKDYSSGKGYDGDCNVKMSHGKPLKGAQTFDFTFTPNNKLRAPDPYS
jgi:hypothetical protein